MNSISGASVAGQQAIAQSTPIANTRLCALGALALGLVVVFAVGFAPTEAVHNAAHDTRHTLAFPCH
jgi:cobalt transporter subunit CbtB